MCVLIIGVHFVSANTVSDDEEWGRGCAHAMFLRCVITDTLRVMC